jgi:ATP phosphoribosyltransferase
MTTIPETQAAMMFKIAIAEGRAAELLEALFEGCGVTLHRPDGAIRPTIIIIPKSEIERLASGS